MYILLIYCTTKTIPQQIGRVDSSREREREPRKVLSSVQNFNDAPMSNIIAWKEEKRILAHFKNLLDNRDLDHVVVRSKILAHKK